MDFLKPKLQTSRNSNRFSFIASPEEDLFPDQNQTRSIILQIPSGLYQDTTDWSTDSKHWNYKAREWSLVYLPDKDHPNLPSHEIPGPSLVVVTEDVVKKVTD